MFGRRAADGSSPRLSSPTALAVPFSPPPQPESVHTIASPSASVILTVPPPFAVRAAAAAAAIRYTIAARSGGLARRASRERNHESAERDARCESAHQAEAGAKDVRIAGLHGVQAAERPRVRLDHGSRARPGRGLLRRSVLCPLQEQGRVFRRADRPARRGAQACPRQAV